MPKFFNLLVLFSGLVFTGDPVNSNIQSASSPSSSPDSIDLNTEKNQTQRNTETNGYFTNLPNEFLKHFKELGPQMKIHWENIKKSPLDGFKNLFTFIIGKTNMLPFCTAVGFINVVFLLAYIYNSSFYNLFFLSFFYCLQIIGFIVTSIQLVSIIQSHVKSPSLERPIVKVVEGRDRLILIFISHVMAAFYMIKKLIPEGMDFKAICIICFKTIFTVAMFLNFKPVLAGISNSSLRILVNAIAISISFYVISILEEQVQNGIKRYFANKKKDIKEEDNQADE